MKKTALILTALGAATPAYAHNGDHSMSLLTTIGHWMSSPTHALFSVVAGIALIVVVAKIAKKRA